MKNYKQSDIFYLNKVESATSVKIASQ